MPSHKRDVCITEGEFLDCDMLDDTLIVGVITVG